MKTNRLYRKLFIKNKNKEAKKDITINEFNNIKRFLEKNPEKRKEFIEKINNNNLTKKEIDNLLKIIKQKKQINNKKKELKEIKELERKIKNIKQKHENRKELKIRKEEFFKKLQNKLNIYNKELQKKILRKLGKNIKLKDIDKLSKFFKEYKIKEIVKERYIFLLIEQYSKEKTILENIQDIHEKYKEYKKIEKYPTQIKDSYILDKKEFLEYKKILEKFKKNKRYV